MNGSVVGDLKLGMVSDLEYLNVLGVWVQLHG